MREMSKSAVGVAREALAVGEASLPRYASRYSRRDGFTLPQLFACLAVRRFLGQDHRGIERCSASGRSCVRRSACRGSRTTRRCAWPRPS